MSNIDEYMKQNLRKVQMKELKILCAIRDICERNNIEYWLDGGTCLGAVRHKGFIPWDDDIDIAMRKSDINKFVEAAKRELPKDLFIQTKETDPSCRLPIIKVRDTNSFTVEFGDDFNRPYQKGLFVDIFPLMPYPNVSRKFCKRVIKQYCKANAILHQQHTYSIRSFAEFFWFGGKRAIYWSIWNLANILLPHNKYFSNSIETNGYGIIHKVKDIFPLSKINFEGELFSAPNNPDAYLTNIYGEYMKLPPENKRKGHAVFYISELI